MFLKNRTLDEFKRHVPDFTIIAAPGFQASPMSDGTRSETFIVLNFRQKLAIIGGTGYAGEIKKTVFTVLNYLLPLEGVLSMHCSANVGQDGDVAIFFGLSGTGKTTLSADPARRLIGDDEHGWGPDGRLQLRGRLLRQGDPALARGRAADLRDARAASARSSRTSSTTRVSRILDLNDEKLTENTRGAYPLDFIANAVPDKRAGHPKNVMFLTCDASGVMPPISRLDPSRRSTTSSRATRARSPAPRSASASSRRSPSAPASAGRSWSTTPTSTRTCCGSKMLEHGATLLAGQHRLDRRAVRRRQAHQHRPHPQAPERGAAAARSPA